MAARHVLHECMADGDDARCLAGFQAPHRPKPSFERSVVALERVVGVPLDVVDGAGYQRVEYRQIRRYSIGHELGRLCLRTRNGAEKEAPGGSDVASWREEDVDDLAEVVEGSVQIEPDVPDFDVG